jgi:hypothetical protein
MADWAREFDEPIPVPKGRRLVTLRDAGDYVAKLPKAKHMTAEWQTAMLALMLVVDLKESGTNDDPIGIGERSQCLAGLIVLGPI